MSFCLDSTICHESNGRWRIRRQLTCSNARLSHQTRMMANSRWMWCKQIDGYSKSGYNSKWLKVNFANASMTWDIPVQHHFKSSIFYVDWLTGPISGIWALRWIQSIRTQRWWSDSTYNVSNTTKLSSGTGRLLISCNFHLFGRIIFFRFYIWLRRSCYSMNLSMCNELRRLSFLLVSRYLCALPFWHAL